MKVFIHLPKTAGTTLLNVLSTQVYFNKFKLLQPTKDTHPKEFLDNVEAQLEKVIQSNDGTEVVGGHFGFAAHPDLSDPSNYFTILRNPVDRVISEYYFMKYKGMYYEKLINEEELDIIRYLNHPETVYLNNLQTRLISGVTYNSGDLVDEGIYQRALNNLKQFAAVGITEKTDDTLALFYHNLRWRRLPYQLRVNVNDQRPDDIVSNEEIEAIKEREKYDIALYEEALLIFENQLNQCNSVVQGIKGKINDPGIYRYYLKILNRVNRLMLK